MHVYVCTCVRVYACICVIVGKQTNGLSSFCQVVGMLVSASLPRHKASKTPDRPFLTKEVFTIKKRGKINYFGRHVLRKNWVRDMD